MYYVSDRRCLEHTVPPGFPERPERLASILEAISWQSSDREVDTAVAAVHPETYVERLERAVDRGDRLVDSADTPLSNGTLVAARAAVGVLLEAVDVVVEADGREMAFAAVRPPGHHAETERAMGFCYLNSVAVAARYLRRERGFDRVAVVDFDVHHGNGTQHIFEEDPSVFYASTHQYPFYPGTGAASERGRGAGEGATLNVPLTAGSGDAEILAALDDEVLPALERFEPQFLLVSAGFDAWSDDPLGGLAVSEDGFGAIGERLGGLARSHCEGRCAAVLEGGYASDSLPRLVSAFAAGAAGPD